MSLLQLRTNMSKTREILVYSDGRLQCGELTFKCALGRGGVMDDKTEGDGATPLGTFPIRKVMYRKDRIQNLDTELDNGVITEDMGWSDDPSDDDYNKLVILPHEAHHEVLWIDDHIYDIVCVLGYNDDPVVSGKGSAVFMHLARENYTPTDGCVALSHDDMLTMLRSVSSDAVVTILRA